MKQLFLILTIGLLVGIPGIVSACVDPMPDCYPCSDTGKQIDEGTSPELGCPGCGD